MISRPRPVRIDRRAHPHRGALAGRGAAGRSAGRRLPAARPRRRVPGRPAARAVGGGGRGGPRSRAIELSLGGPARHGRRRRHRLGRAVRRHPHGAVDPRAATSTSSAASSRPSPSASSPDPSARRSAARPLVRSSARPLPFWRRSGAPGGQYRRRNEEQVPFVSIRQVRWPCPLPPRLRCPAASVALGLVGVLVGHVRARPSAIEPPRNSPHSANATMSTCSATPAAMAQLDRCVAGFGRRDRPVPGWAGRGHEWPSPAAGRPGRRSTPSWLCSRCRPTRRVRAAPVPYR